MTLEEFNALVESAYEAAFAYEDDLIAVYLAAYRRQTNLAVERFERSSLTAAWTPPLYQSLTEGMSEEEIAEADEVRDKAAYAIAALLASVGATLSSRTFLDAISDRAQTNFEQEILRNLRKIVQTSFDSGLTAEATAQAIREQLPQVIPSSAQMLAQTELTALVNERTIVAAQAAFPDGVSKTWLTVGDNRVRAAHAHAQGQTVPIDQLFSVGGASLMYPGDPNGPLRLVARCRCRLSYTNDPTAVTAGGINLDPASAQEDILMSTVDTNLTWTLTDSSGNEINLSGNATDYVLIPSGDTKSTNLTTITISTEDAADAVTQEDVVMEDGPAWRALLAVEGEPTEDGRMIGEGALVWRDPPLSLMALDFTGPGQHQGARVAGRIDRIWRDENSQNEVWGEGVFNGDEFGLHIAELVGSDSLTGNSIDPAGVTVEVWDRESMSPIDGEDALLEAVMDGRELLTVFTHYVIGATTVCPVQAVENARIMLASGLIRATWFQDQSPSEDNLTASAAGMAPLHPPAAWFDNPGFTELTPLTVTDDGRVMGHAAGWNVCHIGEPNGPGVCVTPPRSGMGYEVFHHGCVQTAEGHDVSVGHITMSTAHAGSNLGWKAAQEHYDNSGAVVADVRAGEDRFGIWLSGALRPDLPAAKVREMKAGSISGDWRSVIGRGLEFISALVVNIPGFPIPRPQATIVASAAGQEEVESLVAAGIVECDCDEEGLSRRAYLRQIRALTN